MPTKLVEYRLSSGATVLVEADDVPAQGRENIALPMPGGGTLPDWNASFGQVIPAIEEVFAKLKAMTASPSEIGLEVGIKLVGSAGAILAKVGGEASMTVKLRWERQANKG